MSLLLDWSSSCLARCLLAFAL
ncbi:hypothetical protein NC651_008308 [Populus alba x Populus x berolinensis]|uniref:Uncharacterized protein n=1 Tax=Populus alba x Populus x berolinensis TaxID=444605 RepID=A0AAD6R6M4_9ROSI|nr:hypothetical protein NC651_008308 [Populus alba x Populus x berolinensis]KAJ7003313.1 hypothetical protein NC653_008525 [Populus alba x Populus x berolinensis]